MYSTPATNEDAVILAAADAGATSLGDGDDFLSGDIGLDALLDGTGNDILYGEHGLYGAHGDAWLACGLGLGVLDGNAGIDLRASGIDADSGHGDTLLLVGDDHDFLSGDIGFDALLDGLPETGGALCPDPVVAAAQTSVALAAGAGQDWGFEFLAGADTIDLGAGGPGGTAAADAVIEDGWASTLEFGEWGFAAGGLAHPVSVEAPILGADDIPL